MAADLIHLPRKRKTDWCHVSICCGMFGFGFVELVLAVIGAVTVYHWFVR